MTRFYGSLCTLASGSTANHVQVLFWMCLVYVRRAPSYLMESVTATTAHGSRSRFCSASSCYEQPCKPRKFGERAFAFAGPRYWNTLPAAL